MASAGGGATPYNSERRLQRRLIWRSAQATPYDRPPTALTNNSPSLFAKLVDPASETREEAEPSTEKAENLSEFSEIESLVKQKTLTGSEFEHLIALLHAKTTNSDGDETKKSTSQTQSIFGSTSTNNNDEKMSMEESTPTPTPSPAAAFDQPSATRHRRLCRRVSFRKTSH